ncbi:c-Myc-binding protein-like [Gadus chalcogrammus]|uniref:c-Myc-binding protein-like n=1 Tax=Gadus chalcogrammus TaxID=1042646 RepID=UPI0024C30CAE|nr:c-Myc-binding protein-like [Gadus chalcogrammus]
MINETSSTLAGSGGERPTRRHRTRRMAHYRASDSKREQFRRYLEKGGVLDSLTGVLVSLYEQPEKPSNALDFLKQQLGAAGEEMEETQALRQELARLREQCEVLGEENKDLRSRLQRYEPAPDAPPAAE